MEGNSAAVGPLWSLQAVATELAGPLALDRIAAVTAQAVVDLLGASIVVVAIAGVRQATGLPAGASLNGDLPATVGRHAPHVLRADQGTVVAGREAPFAPEDRACLTVLAGLCGLAVERERLRTLLRHHYPASHVRLGDMEIDLYDHRVTVDGRRTSLTPSEMRLLLFLAEEPGRPRTRREILSHLWHSPHVGDQRACDAHISNLRRKLERDPSHPQRVVTQRGVGYALRVVKVRSHSA